MNRVKTTSDPYSTLGVSRDASSDQIKQAYRDKARQHHPDKQNGNHDTMLELNRAYDCLSDSERRRIYDQTGQVDKARGIDEEVRALLLQAFMAALQSDAVNVLSNSTKLLKDSLAKLQAQLKEVNRAKSKLEARRDKIVVTNDEVENVFQLLLDQKLIQVEGDLAITLKGIEIHELAIKQLKHYKSSEPSESSTTTMKVTWGLGTTSSSGPFTNPFGY